MTDNRPEAPSLAPRIRPARDENVDPIDSAPLLTATREAQAAAPVAELVPASPPTTHTTAITETGRLEPSAPTHAAPPARRMRAEVTVQLTSRVSEQTRDFLDDIVAREGGTVRRAIERAIAAYAQGQN